MTLFPESHRSLFQYFPRDAEELAHPSSTPTGAVPVRRSGPLPLEELIELSPADPSRARPEHDERLLHVALDKGSLGELSRFPNLLRVTWRESKSAAIPKELLSFPGLRVLDLDGTKKVRKLPAGLKRAGFEALRFTNTTSLAQLGDLSGLPKLRRLDFFGTIKVGDYGALNEVTSLEHLSLKSVLLSKAAPQLGELGALRVLDLGGSCALPSSLSAAGPLIARLSGLTGLGLRGAELAALEVSPLPDLRELDLTFVASLSDGLLPGCPDLRGLKLQSHRFPELPPGLGALSELRYLDLSHASELHDESDFSPLASLGSLEQLSLAYVSKLTALPAELGELRALRRLDLGPSVRDVRALAGPPGLPALETLIGPGVEDSEQIGALARSAPSLRRVQVHEGLDPAVLLDHPRLSMIYGPTGGEPAGGWLRRGPTWIRPEALGAE